MYLNESRKICAQELVRFDLYLSRDKVSFTFSRLDRKFKISNINFKSIIGNQLANNIVCTLSIVLLKYERNPLFHIWQLLSRKRLELADRTEWGFESRLSF